MFKVIRFFIYYSLIILVVSSCNSSKQKDYLFDATQLSYGLTPEKVIEIMGEKPDSAFNKVILGKERYIQLYYNKDSSEFRFAKNMFLEAIVHKPKYPFNAQSITGFGLDFQEPSQIDTTAFIKWNNIYKNFDVINFYLVGSKMDDRAVHYKIYFKTRR